MDGSNCGSTVRIRRRKSIHGISTCLRRLDVARVAFCARRTGRLVESLAPQQHEQRSRHSDRTAGTGIQGNPRCAPRRRCNVGGRVLTIGMDEEAVVIDQECIDERWVDEGYRAADAGWLDDPAPATTQRRIDRAITRIEEAACRRLGRWRPSWRRSTTCWPKRSAAHRCSRARRVRRARKRLNSPGGRRCVNLR